MFAVFKSSFDVLIKVLIYQLQPDSKSDRRCVENAILKSKKNQKTRLFFTDLKMNLKFPSDYVKVLTRKSFTFVSWCN